jgi:hypothetical protein
MGLRDDFRFQIKTIFNTPEVKKLIDEHYVDKGYHKLIRKQHKEEVKKLKSEIKKLKSQRDQLMHLRNIDYPAYDEYYFSTNHNDVFHLYNFLKFELDVLKITLMEFYFKIQGTDNNKINFQTENSHTTLMDIGMFLSLFINYISVTKKQAKQEVKNWIDSKFEINNNQNIIGEYKRYIKPYKSAEEKPKYYKEIRLFFNQK